MAGTSTQCLGLMTLQYPFLILICTCLSATHVSVQYYLTWWGRIVDLTRLSLGRSHGEMEKKISNKGDRKSGLEQAKLEESSLCLLTAMRITIHQHVYIPYRNPGLTVATFSCVLVMPWLLTQASHGTFHLLWWLLRKTSNSAMISAWKETSSISDTFRRFVVIKYRL